MRKLLLILFLLFFAGTAFATDYYGGAAGQNINSDTLWYTAVLGSCSGDGSPVASATVLQAGNNLYANGCAITVNVSFTATKISSENGGAANAVAGGDFDVATSTGSPLTITANITGGATNSALHVTGTASGSPVLTIVGNITGGTSVYGVYDAHTAGTVAVTGNVTSGTNSTGYGYAFSGATGIVTITGNITATNANGLYLSSTGTATVTGDCIGSSTTSYSGCSAVSTGRITILGKLIYGTRAAPTSGSIYWTPTATNYILLPYDNSYTKALDSHAVEAAPIYDGSTHDDSYLDAGNTQSGFQIGTLTGTLSGGGGTWGF